MSLLIRAQERIDTNQYDSVICGVLEADFDSFYSFSIFFRNKNESS